jgi:hypothetical protein
MRRRRRALLARMTWPHQQADERAPVARAYACDVGHPTGDKGAQRSVIASLFAVAA